ncbi:MAG TPA: arginine--tRNA ligase, partial [Alphaproteobacteria bacterium]|nr:arginine--tRNA ligase [Alphaproteobacteria bacterium]
MNIFDVMTQLVRQAILSRHDMLQADDVAAVVVEPPRDPSHGDLASNAAMVVSKKLGIKPRDIAEALGADLLQHEHVETAEIAGPGFLNLRLAPSVWWSASLGIVQ